MGDGRITGGASRISPPSVTRPPSPPEPSPIIHHPSPTFTAISRQALSASLIEFTKLMYPGYRPSLFHLRIAAELEAVARGETRYLAIMLPPRHGKSLLSSQHFPAWFLGKFPDKRIIACSYGDDLAHTFSRHARNMMRDDHWPFPEVQPAADARAVKAWEIAGHRGGYRAAGVGSGITGHGANCLVGETQVVTPEGPRDIRTLHRLAYRGSVLAFDQETGTAVWRNVVASREVPTSGLVELRTAAGRSLHCTTDHHVFSPGIGYREAGRFQCGDFLATVNDDRGNSRFHATPQPSESQDSVALVRRVRDVAEPVYDLQVEGTRNFFANGILVHNCLLIDDAVKDKEEADSAVMREKVWDWYQSTSYTRLDPSGGAVVLIGCLTADAQVLHGDGAWRAITETKPGDEVITWNNGAREVRLVEAFIPQGIAPIFELRTRNHVVRGTANHPFLIFEGNGFVWKPLADLKHGDFCVSAHGYEGDRNPHDMTEEDAWFLGFMFGDGWVTRNPNALGSMRWITCFAFGADNAINERALRSFQRIAGRTPKKTRFGYYRTEVARLGRWLEDRGMIGRAKTKRIPDHLFTLPLALREAFLRGFIDADGHVTKPRENGGKPRAVIELANDGLVRDIRYLAMSCGHRVSNITSRTRRSQPPHSPIPVEATAWHISFVLDNPERASFALSFVRSIRPCGEEHVFDLTVADNANFIADGLVVHNTRWNADDLIGRALRDGDYWRVLRLPAEAEEDDPLGRQPGEWLWPEQFSAERYQEIRARIGPRNWNALYQQRPSSEEGTMFPRSAWRSYRPGAEPPMREIVISVDSAFKQGVGSDYTVFAVWGTDGLGSYYVLDRLKERLEFPELIASGHRLYEQWRQRSRKVSLLVEDRSSGQSAIQVWGRVSYGASGPLPALPVIRWAIPAGRSKESRADEVTHLILAGRVYLPENTPWVADFVQEHVEFPHGAHDDQVDTTSQALGWFLNQPRRGVITF